MAVCQPRRLLTLEAEELHHTVSPSKWCVTYEDLQFFESKVRDMQGATLEDEDGPTIYAVTEGYIKPVTAAAGKMSWALMMHPNGLDCDLFISHAWQERVFEFTAKVRTSWPWNARHAWCCMLANPQHLNLGALLQSPSSSPFALALKSAKYVLVVPNRHVSIYTRLWCGYEVFLAYESGKIIQTAIAPVWLKLLLSWFRMLWILVGLAILAAMDLPPNPELLDIASFLPLGCFLVSQTAANRSICLVANHLGAAAALAIACFEPNPDDDSILPSTLPWIPDPRLGLLIASIYFLFAEVERVYWEAEDASEAELRKGYSGSIRNASCSTLRDQANILGEISNQLDQVDRAIQVLLQNGVTSDALRHAHQHGVRLDRAGGVPLAIPGLVLGPLCLCGFIEFYRDLVALASNEIPGKMPVLCLHGCLQGTTLITRIHQVILLKMRPNDERRWILHVLARMVGPVYFVKLVFMIRIAAHGYEWFTRLDRHLKAILKILYHMSLLLAWLFSLWGIRGTLDAPKGVFLANLFMRRATGLGYRQAPDASDSESTDS